MRLIIRENKERSSYRLVVLAERPPEKDTESTSNKLVTMAQKMSLETYDCRIEGAYITRDAKSGVVKLHNEGDKSGFELDDNTVVLVRGDVGCKDSHLDLISQIERYKIPVNNSR